jgi:hypothetical protein
MLRGCSGTVKRRRKTGRAMHEPLTGRTPDVAESVMRLGLAGQPPWKIRPAKHALWPGRLNTGSQQGRALEVAELGVHIGRLYAVDDQSLRRGWLSPDLAGSGQGRFWARHNLGLAQPASCRDWCGQRLSRVEPGPA